MNLKSTSKISKFIKILILTIIKNYFQFNKKNQIKVCNLKKKKIKNIQNFILEMKMKNKMNLLKITNL